MPNRPLAAAALACLLACRAEPPPPAAEPAVPTEAPIATSTATSTATPTAPDTPPPVPLAEALALVPGASTTLAPETQTTVDPAATFRVVLQGTYPEARLSLVDAGDAMLPAAGAREVGAATTLTLQPSAPLRPGSAYRLRVDGALMREVKATDGTVLAPVELRLLAAGEPPPEPKRPRAKKPRR